MMSQITKQTITFFSKADSDIKGSKKFEIDVMRISEYIIKIVGQRKIPENRQGAVVMKLDVEGREMSIVGQYSY